MLFDNLKGCTKKLALKRQIIEIWAFLSKSFCIQVRLQNDKGDNGGAFGRLEVLHKGVWGTVCDNGFGQLEADVICRQVCNSTSINPSS